jgi:hypothetical protein
MVDLHTIFGQVFIELDRVTPVEAGFAEMVRRIFDAGGGKQSLQAQVFRNPDPGVLRSSSTLILAAISSPLVEKSMP